MILSFFSMLFSMTYAAWNIPGEIRKLDKVMMNNNLNVNVNFLFILILIAPVCYNI